MRPRVTLRLDRGGTSSTGPYTLRVGGVDAGTVEPLSSGGWHWYARSNAMGIPWREVKKVADFYAAKAEAVAYVRECLAKKEGAA